MAILRRRRTTSPSRWSVRRSWNPATAARCARRSFTSTKPANLIPPTANSGSIWKRRKRSLNRAPREKSWLAPFLWYAHRRHGGKGPECLSFGEVLSACAGGDRDARADFGAWAGGAGGEGAGDLHQSCESRRA